MSNYTSQKLAEANTLIEEISSVKNTLATKFNINEDVPFSEYPDLISPVDESQITFYKCTSSYHDPYVPAHKNIEIAGMTTPSDGNGTWTNQRPDYSGFYRAWVKDNYMLSFVDGYWYIYDKGATPSDGSSYFSARVLTSTEDGSTENPWIWDNYVSDSDRSITNAINASAISYESGCFYVTLKAGTEYQFGLISNITAGTLSMWASIMPNDSWDEYASAAEDTTGTINGQACTMYMTFTPATDGVYRFRVAGENYEATGDVKYICYPAPEAWVVPSENPWDYTFSTMNGAGTLTLSAVDVAEHKAIKTWAGKRIYQNTKEDGSIYYVPADTVTEGLTWSRFAPNVDEIWSADATLRANYLDDGNYYPDNATVWKIDITTDNTIYYMMVGGAAGNIIDWGDGTQTTIQDKSISTQYKHTYTTAGVYYIQVIGDSVEWINAQTDNSYRNAVSKTNVKEAIQCSKNLLSCNGLFCYCKGLLKIADTFQLPKGVTDVAIMFQYCSELLEAPDSLRFPVSCTNFSSFMYECRKLKANVTHWFDDIVAGENINKNMNNVFYACNAITGTLPAEKLWLDASWRNGGTTVDTRSTFAGCSKLSNYSEIAPQWR